MQPRWHQAASGRCHQVPRFAIVRSRLAMVDIYSVRCLLRRKSGLLSLGMNPFSRNSVCIHTLIPTETGSNSKCHTSNPTSSWKEQTDVGSGAVSSPIGPSNLQWFRPRDTVSSTHMVELWFFNYRGVPEDSFELIPVTVSRRRAPPLCYYRWRYSYCARYSQPPHMLT